MLMPLLILNVQVFSLDMRDRYLTSKEAILHYEHDITIKIPVEASNPAHGGPVTGERYLIHYMDGIAQETIHPEFFYLGRFDEQFVFSTALAAKEQHDGLSLFSIRSIKNY